MDEMEDKGFERELARFKLPSLSPELKAKVCEDAKRELARSSFKGELRSGFRFLLASAASFAAIVVAGYVASLKIAEDATESRCVSTIAAAQPMETLEDAMLMRMASLVKTSPERIDIEDCLKRLRGQEEDTKS